MEYETFKEAQAAKDALNGADMLEQKVSVDWAFVRGSTKKSRHVIFVISMLSLYFHIEISAFNYYLLSTVMFLFFTRSGRRR